MTELTFSLIRLTMDGEIRGGVASFSNEAVCFKVLQNWTALQENRKQQFLQHGMLGDEVLLLATNNVGNSGITPKGIRQLLIQAKISQVLGWDENRSYGIGFNGPTRTFTITKIDPEGKPQFEIGELRILALFLRSEVEAEAYLRSDLIAIGL